MDKLLKGFDKTANQLAHKVGARDTYAAASSRVLDNLKPNVVRGRNLLIPGNIVELHHRETNKTVQIVRRSSDGEMVVDALGGSGEQWFNAQWVVQEASGAERRIRLHNSYNFLAWDPSYGAIVKHVQPHLNPPKFTEWILYDCLDSPQYVIFESVKYPMNYISFESNGFPSVGEQKQSKNCNFAVHVLPSSAKPSAVQSQTDVNIAGDRPATAFPFIQGF